MKSLVPRLQTWMRGKKYAEVFRATRNIARRRLPVSGGGAVTPKGSVSRLRINVSRGRACSDVSNYALIPPRMISGAVLYLCLSVCNNVAARGKTVGWSF